MEKPSPLTWESTAKVTAWNHRYKPPQSSVAVVNDAPKYQVSSRCSPHVNALKWPPEKPVEDYSWIRTAKPVAGLLPPDHPMSPEKLKEAERQAQAAAMAELAAEGVVVEKKSAGNTPSKVSTFSKDNPNNSGFETTSKGQKPAVVNNKTKSAFGEVEKFTAHRMGGHYSSPTKTILEVTRKDEIELQKQRDIAEAKAQFILSGGKLLPPDAPRVVTPGGSPQTPNGARGSIMNSSPPVSGGARRSATDSICRSSTAGASKNSTPRL